MCALGQVNGARAAEDSQARGADVAVAGHQRGGADDGAPGGRVPPPVRPPAQQPERCRCAARGHASALPLALARRDDREGKNGPTCPKCQVLHETAAALASGGGLGAPGQGAT